MKKKLTIIAVILVVIATVLVPAYYSGDSSTPTNANSDSAPNGITFDESSLINRGVTSEQMSNLEQILQQYLSSQGKTPNRIDFNSIYRLPPNPNTNTPFSEITFIIQLDSSPSYKAKMDSFSPFEIRLYLYSLDGNTLLYDSQNVGGSSD